MRFMLIVGLILSSFAAPVLADTPWVRDVLHTGDMQLVGQDGAADIVYDEKDSAVVGIAAHDLALDIGRVTGKTAQVVQAQQAKGDQQVWIGTLGQSALLDGLKLDTSALKDCVECYLIATVNKPKRGVEQALVIIGSDRRGTAYGVYEVSQAIGVSPWYWWADVTPLHKDALYVAPMTRRFGPPSVQYRGMFINDEDWGLEPWAAKTFDPETGNLGPKTYQRVFELMLRLKANTLWPAMHKVSSAFNLDPANAKLADRYAIIMGSSHAEPMLRNNVGEWKDTPEAFNYAINPQGVDDYWRARLKTNGSYENIYTLGMRGIHDSGIVGADSLEGKRDLLNKVVASQRKMLTEEVGKITDLPQIFVPYKEVLDIYKGGLNLPDDVTLVWPDDNFGYLRHFPDAKERARSGSSGVYYHLSYLGAPMAYLWLSTTPPALVKSELTRAFDQGIDRVWIANVGDIKPAEVDISYFFDLAWDVKGVRKQSQLEWLRGFAGRTFGADASKAVGDVWNSYYTENFIRRPEHLQWNLPKQAPKTSSLTGAEIDARLKRMKDTSQKAMSAGERIVAGQKDAYFQLVEYPVRAAQLANQRYFSLECFFAVAVKACAGGQDLSVAHRADDEIKALTLRYNHEITGGKWNGFMNEEPADDDWKSMRIAPSPWPEKNTTMTVAAPIATTIDLPPEGDGWERVEGMGRQGYMLMARVVDKPLSLTLNSESGRHLSVSILPNFPSDNSGAWLVDVQINHGAPQTLRFERNTQDIAWAQGVLNNRLSLDLPEALPGGEVTIALSSKQTGLILEGIETR